VCVCVCICVLLLLLPSRHALALYDTAISDGWSPNKVFTKNLVNSHACWLVMIRRIVNRLVLYLCRAYGQSCLYACTHLCEIGTYKHM
jgi:hypothetical protein